MCFLSKLTPRRVCRSAPSYAQILKKNEQMYHLLAVCVSLCPAVLRWCEENVREQLKLKLENDIHRMNNGDMNAYEKAFAYGCPKFIHDNPPDLENLQDTKAVAYKAQLKMFLAEVRPPWPPPTHLGTSRYRHSILQPISRSILAVNVPRAAPPLAICTP